MNIKDIASQATISSDGLYRYWLERAWDGNLPFALFVMLNPSSADAMKDDPTIRRCKSLARSWGCGSIQVVNLFAARCTNPRDLSKFADAVGPATDQHIQTTVAYNCVSDRPATRLKHIIAAWGAHPGCVERARRVLTILQSRADPPVSVLGLTKAGHPRHPLYIPADTVPTVWDLTNSPYSK